VDLGAGKGRALMIASDFGFSKLVGIEISSAFCSAAATNMHRYYSAMGHRLPS
jgi:tRNA1(Val) A37 N6-methylase TrmN6